jgi:hypothetical protein
MPINFLSEYGPALPLLRTSGNAGAAAMTLLPLPFAKVQTDGKPIVSAVSAVPAFTEMTEGIDFPDSIGKKLPETMEVRHENP